MTVYQHRRFEATHDSERLRCRHTALTPLWVDEHTAGPRKGELHGAMFRCENCGVDLVVAPETLRRLRSEVME